MIFTCFVAGARQDLSRQLFYLYGIAFSLLILLKPLGSSPDDWNYVGLINTGCLSASCAVDVTVDRDFIWFLLVSISPISNGFLFIKLISMLSFVVKMYVIFKLSNNKLYALCVYTFGFLFLHDLTQYRVSLALAFFLLAIYFFARSQKLAGGIATVSSIGAHLQAVPALGLWFFRVPSISRATVVWWASAFLGLMLAGLYPPLSWLVSAAASVAGQVDSGFEDILKYIELADSGVRAGLKNVSVFSVVLVFVLSLLRLNMVGRQSVGYRAAALKISLSSVLFGYFLYFIFGSVFEMQNRFFEFFSVPLAIIFGACSHSFRNFFGLMLVCGCLALTYKPFWGFFIS